MRIFPWPRLRVRTPPAPGVMGFSDALEFSLLSRPLSADSSPEVSEVPWMAMPRNSLVHRYVDDRAESEADGSSGERRRRRCDIRRRKPFVTRVLEQPKL